MAHEHNDLVGTFHRRDLRPPAVSFSSADGRNLFREALQDGTMEAYFLLAEHYMTQGHPAFCGVASLTMAMNALLLDPKRVWQGVWRWFDESMLDCCEDLEKVRHKGTTLAALACVGRCNGASIALKYGADTSIDQFRQDILDACTLSSSMAGDVHRKYLFTGNHFHQQAGETAGVVDSGVDSAPGAAPNEETRNEKIVLIASYSRKELAQTGSGHFSPIGGFHTGRDMVLIMDVARFKYPPHWVPLNILYTAMQHIDPETNRSRGYLLVRSSSELQQNMLRKCNCSCSAESVADELIAAAALDSKRAGDELGQTAADSDQAFAGDVAGDATSTDHTASDSNDCGQLSKKQKRL